MPAIKQSARALARQPVYTGVVVLTLALGIGATIAIFSVVNAVLLRDLPYPEPDRLVALHTITADGLLTGPVAPRDMPTLYDDHPLLEAAALAFYTEGRIVGGDGTEYNMGRYGVTDQFFDVFNVPMALGRGFERGEPAPPAMAAQGTVVISYATWRDIFDFDPDIIGKPIQIEIGTRPVVGVTPEGFDFPGSAGYWTLMQLSEGFANLRRYQGYLRLGPGVTRPLLEEQLALLSRDLGPDPGASLPLRFVTRPLLEQVIGDVRPTVLLLFGATALLLFIACINVANLQLSRGAERVREVALRTAVGARRGRIFHLLLTESLILAAAGGVLGLIVGVMGIRLMLGLAPADLPRLDSVPIDGTVLLFAFAATFVTALVIGLVPAWRLSRADLRAIVNEGGRGASGGRQQQRVFGSLVVAEVGLAVLLVIGAGMLIRNYVALVTTDPGFRTEQLLSAFVAVPFDAVPVTTSLPPGPDGEPRFEASYQPIADFFREVEQRVGAIAGVEAVTVGSTVPLSSRQWDYQLAFTIQGGATLDANAAQPQAMQRSVSPSFFSVMGVPMLAGRSLESADRRGAPGVAVVNETLVRRYLPGQDPLGKKLVLLENIWQAGDIGFQYGERVVDEVEIVGVVADLRYTGLGDPAEASIYLSNDQYTTRRHNVIVRAALSEPASLAGAIREEINAIARMPVEFELYSQAFRHALARDRFGMSLLATFGVIALVLAAIGVYGLMSYSITQRTGEIAVRAALGASARDVVALVMRRGAWLALTGIAVGLAAAVLVHAVLGSRLYELTTVDWRVFVAAPVVLFAVALLAAYVPARRAARIDPAVMLRTQ